MIPKDPVAIVEVGPRDGLQNLTHYLDTNTKIQLIHLLAQSGLREIEVGGFVSPKAIPQFRDIRELVKGLPGYKGIKFAALIPNLRGAQDALECGVRKVHFVFSVSQSHNLNNVRKTPEESLAELGNITELLASHPGVELSVDLATTFGCPFEMEVKKDDIMHYLDRIRDLGLRSVTLCDTVGYGNPRQVRDIFSLCMGRYPEITFRAHFHDTRGLGLVNTLVAYQVGVRSFDSSIGGLGGCPFAPGASGNVATEDQAFMFKEMEIETGVDIRSLFKVCQFLEENIPGVSLTSALYRAGLPGDHKICKEF
jgi:hydroxymethylglutaryl-CoA lyase